MLRRLFSLETFLDEFGDSFQPPLRHRKDTTPAVRPLYMGLCAREFEWELRAERDYFKIDMADFLDFATSELAIPSARLGDFKDQRATFYENLAANVQVPDFSITYLASEGRGRLLDFVTARDRQYVSVSARFEVSFHDGDGMPRQTFCTVFFAPPDDDETIKLDAPAYEAAKLIEWARSHADPPTHQDREWRLKTSGVLLDRFLERHGERLSSDRRAQLRSPVGHPELFELTRLGLSLPAYIRFMYDLVEEEHSAVGTRKVRRTIKRGGKRVTREQDEVVYRTIRSIRVIHPDAGPTSSKSARTRRWSAPAYAFAVRGHWRHFDDSSRRGHDSEGKVIFGKTWVTEYTKGEEYDGQLSPIATQTRVPNVVVGIKQPLHYARDVIEAAAKATVAFTPAAKDVTHPPAVTNTDEDKPSLEWMATERAKLTAGLRYLVLRRDNYTCQVCGKRQADENYVRLEVDHKIAVSEWGRTEERNLWTLCRECNRGKFTLPV